MPFMIIKVLKIYPPKAQKCNQSISKKLLKKCEHWSKICASCSAFGVWYHRERRVENLWLQYKLNEFFDCSREKEGRCLINFIKYMMHKKNISFYMCSHFWFIEYAAYIQLQCNECDSFFSYMEKENFLAFRFIMHGG